MFSHRKTETSLNWQRNGLPPRDRTRVNLLFSLGFQFSSTFWLDGRLVTEV